VRLSKHYLVQILFFVSASVKLFFIFNSNEMRQKFYNALSDLLKKKREDNKSFLNKEEYLR